MEKDMWNSAGICRDMDKPKRSVDNRFENKER